MEPAEDDSPAFPDFGSAFPSPIPTAPSTSETPLSLPQSTPSKPISSTFPSRPSAADEDDDFFDRYPGATPDKLRNRQPPPDVRRGSINVTETVDVSSRAVTEGEGGLTGETRTLVEGETGRRGSIMVVESVDISSRGAWEEERGMVVGTRANVEPSGEHEYNEKVGGPEDIQREADEETAVFAPDETAEAQAAHLEEAMPSATLGVQAVITSEEDMADEEARSLASGAEVHPPEEHYEYQGEITELDEALDESVAAPLMDDEEPAPTISSRTATMQEPEEELLQDDSDEENVVSRPPPQPLQSAHAVAERSFTTNFTDLPRADYGNAEASKQSEPPIAEEWPAAGDDKTFGDFLDTEEAQVHEAPDDGQATYGDQWPEEEADNDFLDDAPPQHSEQPWSSEGDDDTFGQILGDKPHSQSNGITSHDDGPVEEDLSAAWAAAMDDDEILNEAEIDPKAFFGDDDELLDDEPFLMDLAQQAPSEQVRSSRPSYAPANSQSPMKRLSYGTPSTPFLDQTSARSGGTPSTGLFDVYNHAAPIQPQQRPPIPTAQSFADKSKGGYQSPYDLPMDVVKPRRRAQQPPQPQVQQMPKPPPRTSSFHGAPPVLSPPNSSHGVSGAAPPTSARTTPKTDAGFFADLPMASKPRTRPSGAYTPQLSNTPVPPMPNGQQLPPRGGPVQPPQTQPGYMQQRARPVAPPTPQQQQTPMLGGLRQPDRNPLFPDQPSAYAPQFTEIPPTPASGSSYGAPSHMPLAAPPPSTNRFSPAPSPSAAAPAAASRYSPAPPAQPQQQQHHQPPAKPVQRQPSAPAVPPPAVNRAHSFVPRTSSPLAQHGPPSQIQHEHPDMPRGIPFSPSSPPTTNGLHLSPQRRESGNTKYTPPSTSAGPQESPYAAPPQRPRTQSPGTVMKTARIGFTPLERPGSTGPPSSMYGSSAPHPMAIKAPVHRRQFSREMSFAVPQDERAQDPLERWKGHAIFKWGPSGTVVTSFPKHMPFYGQGAPTIKCTSGDVKLQDAKDVLPLSDRDV
ncbi:vesicle coat component, partial [Oleoguttula sp. CCFEE 5521]